MAIYFFYFKLSKCKAWALIKKCRPFVSIVILYAKGVSANHFDFTTRILTTLSGYATYIPLTYDLHY